MGRSELVGCAACLLLGVVVTSAGCGGAETSPSRGNAGGYASAGRSAAEAGTTTNGGTGFGQAGTTTNGGRPPLSSGGESPDLAGTGGGAGLAGGGTDGPETTNFYVDELRAREGCLPRLLPVVETAANGFEAGQVRCQIDLVMMLAENAPCSCDAAQHLRAASAGVRPAIATRLRDSGVCGNADGVDCQNVCICELEQSRGDALTQCQNDTTPIAELPPGFCYVDTSLNPPLGNPALVASCPESSRRELRVLGPTPQPAPLMFVACTGQTI